MECAPYLKVRAPGKLLWFTVLNDTPRCLRCWYFLTPAFCGARLLAIVAGSRINICMDVFQLLLWHFQGVCAGREVCAILCSLFLFWRSKRAGKKKNKNPTKKVCATLEPETTPLSNYSFILSWANIGSGVVASVNIASIRIVYADTLKSEIVLKVSEKQWNGIYLGGFVSQR